PLAAGLGTPRHPGLAARGGRSGATRRRRDRPRARRPGARGRGPLGHPPHPRRQPGRPLLRLGLRHRPRPAVGAGIHPPRVERRHRYERDVTVTSIPDSVARRLYGSTTGGAGGTLASDRAIAPGANPRSDVTARLLAQARATLAGVLPTPTRDPDERASNVFAVGP